MEPLAELLMFALVAWVFAYWLAALADAIGRPRAEFEAVGRSKALWILAILVFELLGAVAYKSMVRRELKRAPGDRLGSV